jgi:parvulin-like peptidyl-prolyl isomerase
MLSFPKTIQTGLLLIGLFLLGVPAANGADSGFSINGKKVPAVVARVNGVDLSSKVLKNQLETFRLMAQRQEHPTTPETEAAFAKEALTQMVNQELVFQRARALKISVDSKTIDEEIKKITDQFPSEEMFHMALKAQGMTMDLLKSSLEKQIAEEEYLRKEIVPKVDVPDSRAEEFYEKNADQFRHPAQYTVHHIYVASAKPEELPEDPALRKKAKALYAMMDKDARSKIESMKNQLDEGADFETLAKEVSEHEGSAEKGGLLGTVSEGDVAPEMAKVMKTMKPGEISGIVRTRFGYHILMLKSFTPPGVMAFAKVKTDILNALMKEEVQKTLAEEVDKLRKKSKIQLFF